MVFFGRLICIHLIKLKELSGSEVVASDRIESSHLGYSFGDTIRQVRLVCLIVDKSLAGGLK